MFKKLAFTALVVASVSAMAQDWGTREHEGARYNTYAISSVDLNTEDFGRLRDIVDYDLRQGNAADKITIETFVDRLPSDQAFAVLKGIATNYKQASMVRDEVAMARFGTDQPYAWLNYPLLTWSDTPGQNSWTALNLPNNSPASVTMTDNGSTMIAMTDDSSRPMRMVMNNRAATRDIDYDRAVFILGSGLKDIEKGNIREVFHPSTMDPNTYTNETVLDSIIRTIEANAALADHLDRYAWYNHFDKDYYSKHNWNY